MSHCNIEGYVSPYSSYYSPVVRCKYAFEDEPDSYYDVPISLTSSLTKKFRQSNVGDLVSLSGAFHTNKLYPYISFSATKHTDYRQFIRDSYGYVISTIQGTISEVNKNKISKYKDDYNTLKLTTDENTLLQLYWDSVSWDDYFSKAVGKSMTFKVILLEYRLVIVEFTYT